MENLVEKSRMQILGKGTNPLVSGGATSPALVIEQTTWRTNYWPRTG
ncbi:hypothetical protein STRTUCAR8_06473 [Streptomyces turgidiscabies Car8]|uniref:Uncharacterized protein n=1 Tax=Streptomyces turgidiscabies (strain Car8) TaxID=698760 RepID=L7ERW9_STRT8|nr:hypothetical protein STRTUCAR8_06473 [Streptomyces turgidiscabies Car8]